MAAPPPPSCQQLLRAVRQGWRALAHECGGPQQQLQQQQTWLARAAAAGAGAGAGSSCSCGSATRAAWQPLQRAARLLGAPRWQPLAGPAGPAAPRQQLAQLRRGFAADAAPAAAGSGGGGSGKKSPISFNTMLLGVGAFLAVVAVAQNRAQQKVAGMMQRSQEVVGKASVGGPFRLVDGRGRPFTEQDLLGRFSVVYFGFTHCPDICPDELEKLATALDLIEKQTKYQVRPVFISVDPARDTPAKVAAYVADFHPRLIGLTGSEDAVRAVSKAYRVYFHKTGDSDTDYLVDHSIIMYLMDPAGEFVTFYGKNFTAQQLADSIGQHIAKWQAAQGGAGSPAAAAAAGGGDARVKTGTAGSQEGLAQR